MALTLAAGLRNTQILLKKLCQTFDHAALLLGSVSAAKSEYRGQDSVNIRSGSLQRAVPEGVVNKFLGFLWLQSLCADDLVQILFHLFVDKVLPIPLHYNTGVFSSNSSNCVASAFSSSGSMTSSISSFSGTSLQRTVWAA